MNPMKIGNSLLNNLLTNSISRTVNFSNHMAIQFNNRGFVFAQPSKALPYYYTLVQYFL